MQAMLRLVYPPRCMGCNVEVSADGMLCGNCRLDTPFITGLVCDCCGVPLPGQGDANVLCDDCLTIMRPWKKGRAAVLYQGKARSLIMRFKHGDRVDLAEPMADWMVKAASPIITADMLVVPVPVHWTRLVRRRYNQAALLGKELAKRTGLPILPDALIRKRRTKAHEKMTRAERFANMAGAVDFRLQNQNKLQDRNILLVDDVMTSGATLAACAEALHLGGVNQVFVTVLARVAKSD